MIVLTILIYLIILIAASIAVFLVYYKWCFTYWNKWDIPTLNPKFPFGDLENMVVRKRSRIEELRDLHLFAKKKGYKHIGMYQLASPTYFVVDLDLIRDICIKDFEHFTDRNFYSNEKDDPIGMHLFSLEGERWKNARKVTATIFTANKLKWMFQNFLECITVMMEFLDTIIESGGQPVNVKDITARFTSDAVGSSVLGVRCRSFTGPDQNFLKYGHRALETDRRTQARLLFGMFFPDFARKLKLPQISRDVAAFFIKVISETISRRRKDHVERKDFLQLMMKLQDSNPNGKNLTLNEVIALSFGLFIGGFETSSNTMSFCLFSLAQHPEYQEKLRQEVLRVLKKYNDEITYEGLFEMTYMQQVLDETWRMYPAVHTLNRVCTKEYKVPGHNLVIKKGIKTIVTVTGVHRDPESYDRPNEFYPDHFTEENKRKRHPYAYIPFGVGPRKCVGGRYANLQLKAALASLIRKYRFVLDKKTQLPLRLAKYPMVPVAEGGVWINFEKR